MTKTIGSAFSGNFRKGFKTAEEKLAEAVSNQEFKREERYIVIKIKRLSDDPYARERIVERIKNEAGGAVVDCLVIEADWPEYEPTWNSIQSRAEATSNE